MAVIILMKSVYDRNNAVGHIVKNKYINNIGYYDITYDDYAQCE